MNRFMVIKENGNIVFTKVWIENGEHHTQEFREYNKTSQQTLNFAEECQERFDNEYPEWADIITWELINEEDLRF